MTIPIWIFAFLLIFAAACGVLIGIGAALEITLKEEAEIDAALRRVTDLLNEISENDEKGLQRLSDAASSVRETDMPVDGQVSSAD